MSLEKEKQFDNGFSGSYWKIISLDIVLNKSVRFKVGLFKDSSKKDNPSNILETKELNLPYENVTDIKDLNLVLTDCYMYVKTYNFNPQMKNSVAYFLDAEDV